ncbi:MAG: hypothetical protein ACRDHD_06435 [Candidatus Limnocylindria bacterium]
MRRAATTIIAALLTAGCAIIQPAGTPTPGADASVEATPSVPVETPLPSAEPSVEATPGLADVPAFAPGSRAATNVPGLNVRSRAGTEQRRITTLGVDANLLIGLGPVMVDGLGWYLVRDADDDDPAFGEGWVAAGFEPDPFLIPAAFDIAFNPYLAGFAHDASGEFGPVILPGRDVSIRWIASPLSERGCSFAVDLRPGAGEPVPAIRATLGSAPAPGELFSQFFASHPELTGDLFVTVTSECSWALTFVLASPHATPSPAPGG